MVTLYTRAWCSSKLTNILQLPQAIRCLKSARHTCDVPVAYRDFTFFERTAIGESRESRVDDSIQTGEDVDNDSVYELTVADVHRELASIRLKQRYNDAGFRTKARCDPMAFSENYWSIGIIFRAYPCRCACM